MKYVAPVAELFEVEAVSVILASTVETTLGENELPPVEEE